MSATVERVQLPHRLHFLDHQREAIQAFQAGAKRAIWRWHRQAGKGLRMDQENPLWGRGRRRIGSLRMGRVSATPVVETAWAFGVPELLALARQQGGGPSSPDVVVVNLETRPASTLFPNSRVVFVLCPQCGSCRRALFWVGGRLACRRCHRLRYQSQTHAHWTGPLLDALQARRRLLASRPGPKGRRYRAWVRGWNGLTATSRRGWAAGTSVGDLGFAGKPMYSSGY
jgi:hypothetical protein